MGILNPEPIWHDEIYAVDLETKVEGGPPVFSGNQAISGFANASSKQLADNILYLRDNAVKGEIERVTLVANQDFTPGTTNSIPLEIDPVAKENIQLYFDGLYQQQTEFSLDDSTLTLNSPIPEMVEQVEIFYTYPLPYGAVVPTARQAAEDIVEEAFSVEFSNDADVRKYGALPTNSPSENRSAIQEAANSGKSRLVIKDLLRVDGYIILPDTIKEVVAEPGAGIVRVGEGSIFVKSGALLDPGYAIPSDIAAGRSTIPLGPEGAPEISEGDWIYIQSADNIPNVTAGSRVAMLRRVESKGSNFLYLDAAIFRNMSANTANFVARYRRIAFGTGVRFVGGIYTSEIPVQNRRPLFNFILCRDIFFENVDAGEHGGAAFSLIHCLGGGYINSHTHDLIDDRDNGNLGYGTILSGACRGFQWVSGRATRCRHGITTGSATMGSSGYEWAPTDASWWYLLQNFGEPEACYFGPVYVSECTNAGVDTHEQGYGITIVPNINGGFDGINIRCNESAIIGGSIIGCRRSSLRVSSAASNPTSTWEGTVRVKGTYISGVAHQEGTRASGFYMTTPGGVAYLDSVDISQFRLIGVETTSNLSECHIRGGRIDGVSAALGSTGISLASNNGSVDGVVIMNCGVGVQDDGTGNRISRVEYSGNIVNYIGPQSMLRDGVDQSQGFIKPGDYISVGGEEVSTFVPTVNNLYAIPFYIPNTCTLNSWSINVTSASGNLENQVLRLAIYRDTGEGYPGVRFSGFTLQRPIGAPGVLTYSVSPGIVLTPGIYWAALVSQGTQSITNLIGCRNSMRNTFAKTASDAFGSPSSYMKSGISGGIPTGAFGTIDVTVVDTAPKIVFGFE